MKQVELKTLVEQGVLQQTPDRDLWEQELAELEASGFLQSLAEDKAYTFSNNLTWEVVYETLLYAERRRLHALVARHLEKHNAEHLETVAGLLLYHYELAQVPDKCVRYGAMAGDRAAAMFANDDAVECYDRALAALDTFGAGQVADRSLVDERMGDVYETAGHYPEAVKSLTRALDTWCSSGKGRKPKRVPWRLKASTREAELCRKIAVSYERQSEYDQSLQWLDEASKRLPARPGRVAAQVCASRSVSLFRKGEYQEGMQWGQRALKLAKRSGQPADVAYAHNMLANSYIETGLLRKAIRHLQQAVELYDQLGDFPGIAAANSNLASCYGFYGEIEAAIRHFDVALQADERMSNASSIAIDHQNLGHVLTIRGKLDEAIEHLQKVVGHDESDTRRPDLAGAAYIDLCQCQLLGGNTRQAEQFLDKGLELLRQSGQAGLILDAELELVELRLAQNAPQQAHDLCVEILTRIRALDATLYEARAERALGEALAGLDKTNDGLSHLKNSIRIAHKIGADHEEARSLIVLASINLRSGRESKSSSLKKLQRAMTILEKMGASLELAAARKLYERFS